jgi:hypothetical protein
MCAIDVDLGSTHQSRTSIEAVEFELTIFFHSHSTIFTFFKESFWLKFEAIFSPHFWHSCHTPVTPDDRLTSTNIYIGKSFSSVFINRANHIVLYDSLHVLGNGRPELESYFKEGFDVSIGVLVSLYQVYSLARPHRSKLVKRGDPSSPRTPAVVAGQRSPRLGRCFLESFRCICSVQSEVYMINYHCFLSFSLPLTLDSSRARKTAKQGSVPSYPFLQSKS